MNQPEQRQKALCLSWTLLFSLRMEALQMQKFKRWDIYFQGRDAPAILRIYCLDNINESDQSWESHLPTKKFKRSIRQFYLKRVVQLFISFQMRFIYIILNRKVILVWRWTYFKNIHLYVLTFLTVSFTMRAERQKTDWKNGSYF